MKVLAKTKRTSKEAELEHMTVTVCQLSILQVLESVSFRACAISRFERESQL